MLLGLYEALALHVRALDQMRSFVDVRVTSVKLLIADSKRTFSDVRSGPIAYKLELGAHPKIHKYYVLGGV
jgi:hypothetical protein